VYFAWTPTPDSLVVVICLWYWTITTWELISLISRYIFCKALQYSLVFNEERSNENLKYISILFIIYWSESFSNAALFDFSSTGEARIYCRFCWVSSCLFWNFREVRKALSGNTFCFFIILLMKNEKWDTCKFCYFLLINYCSYVF